MINRMRHALATSAAVFFALMLVPGCVQMGPSVVGSGVARSESRSTGEFSSVQSNISANIDVTVSPATEVIVEGDDNIVPLIKTEVRGGSLVIFSDSSFQSKTSTKVTIKTPQLTALVINGSGNADVRGLGGGSFSGSINGSGNLTAMGKVEKLDGQITGSGDLRLGGLTAQSATIAIVGSGDATVDPIKSLSAHITGSGDVVFKSSTALIVQKEVIGSGNVRPM